MERELLKMEHFYSETSQIHGQCFREHCSFSGDRSREIRIVSGSGDNTNTKSSNRLKHKTQATDLRCGALTPNRKVDDGRRSFSECLSMDLRCTLTLAPPALLSFANFTQSGVKLHANAGQHGATGGGGLCLCLEPDVEIYRRGLAE